MNQFIALLDHVPPALLVICRIGGLAIYGPVIGSSIIPGRVRVMLAVILGLAVYPVLNTQELGNAGWQMNLWSLGPAIALELLVGMVIGFLASLPLLTVQLGGLMMGHQMGLGFAKFFNPAMEDTDAGLLAIPSSPCAPTTGDAVETNITKFVAAIHGSDERSVMSPILGFAVGSSDGSRVLRVNLRNRVSSFLGFCWLDDLAYAYTEVLVEHQHFTSCHMAIIDENINRITSRLVQFDHRVLVQPKHILDIHSGASKLDLDVQINIVQQRQGC